MWLLKLLYGNKGRFSGKEVVQVYYSAPKGKLGKSAKVLGAFKKTKCLNPGETEKIKLSFKIEDMASYDDVGKCNKSSYILEKGEYSFYVGNSISNTKKADYTYIVEGINVTPESGVFTTCFPCATLLACTWNEEILYEMGKIGALEAKENNLMIWLTPAMNIHRTPLCGRNFEYFSEDPLLSGKMAAATVRGIQSQYIIATPKHLACNNREINRFNSNSIVSERALKEIYLKGFEICIKKSSPKLIMSSYNLINGIRASENYDMLTGILREEWGYKGAVTTDWGNQAHQINEIAAGNDLRMPYGNSTELKELLFGWKRNGHIGTVQESAKRILSILLALE